MKARAPGLATRAAATDGISSDNAHLNSRHTAAPQPSSAAARQLVEHPAQDRAIRLERVAGLRAAYGALRRADELGGACDLRRAATVALGHLAETRGDLAKLHEFERFAGLQS